MGGENLHFTLLAAGISLQVCRGMADIFHARLNYSPDDATSAVYEVVIFHQIHVALTERGFLRG